MKKNVFIFVIGFICATVITVGANILYKAEEVSYINSNVETNNVQDALDDIMSFKNQEITSDRVVTGIYKERNNTTGSISTKIKLNKGKYICVNTIARGNAYEKPNYEINNNKQKNIDILGCDKTNEIYNNMNAYGSSKAWSNTYLIAMNYSTTFTCNVNSEKDITIKTDGELNFSNTVIPNIMQVVCVKYDE